MDIVESECGFPIHQGGIALIEEGDLVVMRKSDQMLEIPGARTDTGHLYLGIALILPRNEASQTPFPLNIPHTSGSIFAP
mmetsp:Transcript_24684/g.55834  ORF Transcript_24684/g.55834 Transcript_24684/m.55834 type:complete len:80 (+) Transcript_24684:675-914(+)